MKLDQHHDNVESDLMESLHTHDSSFLISSKIDSPLEEFADYPMPPGIMDEDYDSERDILIRKDLPSNNTLSFVEKQSFHSDIPPFSPFMHELMITLALHQEKSPDLLSHRGLKAFQHSAKCPMMIHGQNNPILDVLLFHFYPS
nr:hypothetical protein [Tanacetum cinerariifolium]